ncbi:MAG: cytochrome c oxidase subunit II [Gemmatimonadota bacterium]|nr:MAG: cytochrome c oxidase subunit II [Gemmatimonadota bacterium]
MSEKRQTTEAIALAVLFLGLMVFTVVGFGMRTWQPPAASKHASELDGMIRYLLITTGVVFVLGHVVLVAFLVRYGRGKKAPSPATSARSEKLWSILPVVFMALISEVGVLFIGLPVWDEIYGDVPENAVTVEVTARQFEWIARYPGPDGAFGRVEPELVDGQRNPLGLDPADGTGADDLVMRNQLHLPVDRAALLLLRSHDVLHSFSVAAFRVKQDIVPGMSISTMFTPNLPGTYEIGCAELCGLGHYRMRGRVIVHTESDFSAWLRDQTEGTR